MGMRIKYQIILILFLLVFSIDSVKAQGALCEVADPFCAGNSELVFPNSNPKNSRQITAEPGPNYTACDPAFDPRYPSWFFLQIENSGNLNFTIAQNTKRDFSGSYLDVDFIVWGPFSRGEDYCSSADLNSGNMVDCSFLPDSVERMSIPNAQADDLYVVLITNYESEVGYISLKQNNANTGGSTDCTILSLDLGDEIAVCEEEEYILDGTTNDAGKYEWYVFNENTSQYEIIQGEEDPTILITSSGKYKLVVTDLIEGKTEEDEVIVTFYDEPKIGEVEELFSCSSDTEFIDLTEISQDLIAPNGGVPGDYNAIFYETQEDVESLQPISQPQAFSFEDGATLYAQVEDVESGCFSQVESFNLRAFNFANYQLEEFTVFCVDNSNALLSPVSVGFDLGPEYSYEWYVGNSFKSTNPIIVFNTLPEEEIRVKVIHSVSGCENEFISDPVAVSGPGNVDISISGSDFGDGYTVKAIPKDVTGEEFTDFEYRLDNGNWQEVDSFNKVAPGNHTVAIRDVNGCGEITSASFFLVGYPRFFSPNSDGYNDTWDLLTDANITIKKLFVFDRYGKLLRQLDPLSGKGWDGTYNGKLLPADDYWFRVEFVDEKTGEYQEYMSNFTLLR